MSCWPFPTDELSFHLFPVFKHTNNLLPDKNTKSTNGNINNSSHLRSSKTMFIFVCFKFLTRFLNYFHNTNKLIFTMKIFMKTTTSQPRKRKTLNHCYYLSLRRLPIPVCTLGEAISSCVLVHSSGESIFLIQLISLISFLNYHSYS